MELTELHLKYRPQSWDAMIGHRSIIKSIRSALAKKSGRAFLLTGDSGLGKTTIARLIAKEKRCTPIDILEIDGATNTRIDAMREVTSRLQYKSMSGYPRTVILDECHSLSKQSWQSLLKSLEEPPEDVYWILCTTDPSRVPKTVKTRCLQYDLQPVEMEDLLDLLKIVRNQENLAPTEKALALTAQAANGSPRQALVYLAICGHLKKSTSIIPLLQVAGEPKEAIDLSRLLLSVSSGRPSTWKKIAELLRALQIPPESARIVVLRYMASVMLGGNAQKAGEALTVIEAFSTPFLDREGADPLVRACAEVWLGSQDGD